MCVSSDGSGYIQIMDSLARVGFSVQTLLQLAKLYSIPRNNTTLNIKRLSVQQQKGSFDCGLFCIANAYEICSGRNPEDAHFAQQLMRPHLFQCLSMGVMRSFPMLPARESLQRLAPGVLSIKLYCHCRMPAQFDTDMIECDSCNQWYHCSCVKVNPAGLPLHWECSHCHCK